MYHTQLKMNFSNNKDIMITSREKLFEFMDLSDELLKRYGLKKKLETEVRLSNNTLWHICHRKEQALPPNFFLNRFWYKFFDVVYYTFDLLDNELASSNFAELEERYGKESKESLEFYLTILYDWIQDTHRTASRYSTLLELEQWQYVKDVPTYEDIFQNLSGREKSGRGWSGLS